MSSHRSLGLGQGVEESRLLGGDGGLVPDVFIEGIRGFDSAPKRQPLAQDEVE